MNKLGFASMAALLCTVPAVAQSPTHNSGATGIVAAQILAIHNAEREAVGHPPLEWDPSLAEAAAEYGPVLASIKRLVHSPRHMRPRQHENLAMAWSGTHTPEQLLDMWVVEKKLLVPGVFPNVSRTGNWKDVGHYTTMVWKTTTHVGCAIHHADWDYLICRYSPPGNVDGKPVFDGQVLAAR